MNRVGQRGVWAKAANHHGRNALRQSTALPLIADASASPLRVALHITTIRCVINQGINETLHYMVQAARSGVQNIAEGSVASGTSKKTEIKLTNVARASHAELMLDFEQFLRQHGLKMWEKDSPEARAVREKYLLLQKDKSDKSDKSDRSLRPATI